MVLKRWLRFPGTFLPLLGHKFNNSAFGLYGSKGVSFFTGKLVTL
jgi:hypothetical protein